MKENIRNEAIKRLIQLNYNEKTAPHIVDTVIEVFSKAHPREITSNIILIGKLKINANLHEVFYGGKKIELTRNQYRFLEYFARNAGTVLTHEKILRDIWGNSTAYIEYIRVMINALREKIAPDIIKTKLGVGYYMESPDLISK